MLNPNATITIDDVQGLKCLLIDNAFLNPDELRQYAKDSLQTERKVELKLGYEIHPADIDQRIPNYKDELASTIDKHIGASIREFFGVDDSVASLKAFKGPYFNCVGVKELPFFMPHVDTGQVSTFAYLNLPENCGGGTRLFRHIPTNSMNVVQGMNSLRKMIQKPLDKPLVESTEEWELIKFFEMKYNRLIAFNSSTIHKIDLTGAKFTMDIDTTRLTLNCFFRYTDADGKPAFERPAN